MIEKGEFFMNDEHDKKGRRIIDRWLPVAATFAGIVGVLIGMLFRIGGAYQVVRDDHDKVIAILSWKEKQEEFNRETTVAIARLQEITKRIR